MSDSAASQKRLELFNRLASLPKRQLDQAIAALKPDEGWLPPAPAPSRDRVTALLAWAESSTGGGLGGVEHSLEALLRGYLSYGLPMIKPPATREAANEAILINAVWAEVEERLRQSLHTVILSRLDRTGSHGQVSRPWGSQLRVADPAFRPLPANTHIAEVFDRQDVEGQLLVVGALGAGKTTTLLDLAAVLIQRANDQPDHPIPVIFNLSSWQQSSQSITDWLVSELNLKYGVLPRLGQSWLAEKKLLPLLDDLDVLPLARQKPVMQAINAWMQSGEGPSRLVVCSHLEVYERCPEALALSGIVRLEPLTDKQIQTALNSLQVGDLWETWQRDAGVLDLASTPLLLTLLILVQATIAPMQWQQKQTDQEKLDYLLDTYVEQRLHEAVNSQEYPPGQQPTARQTRYWLGWLAKQLQTRSHDEFLIETLQPKMLTTSGQESLYGLMMGLIVGLGLGVVIGLFGLMMGLVLGFIGALNDIDMSENFELSFARFSPQAFCKTLGDVLRRGLFIWPIAGLVIGLIIGLREGVLIMPVIGLVVGPFVGLLLGLLIGPFVGLFEGFKTDILLRVRSNQGIRSALKRTVILLTIALLLISGVVIFSLSVGLDEVAPTNNFFAIAILVSIYTSGLVCAQHFMLRVILYANNAIPWNYARFLNYCVERLLLQRVGGGYRFRHKLVQVHFAAMPMNGR